MKTKKIRYLLEERGRYYYQRKVPKNLVPAIKADRWHLPVGPDFEIATDRVKELKKEHDAIIAKAKADPSFLVTLRRDGEARVQTKEKAKAKPLADFIESVRSGEIDCFAARAEMAFQNALAEEEGPAWLRTPDFLDDLQESRKPSVEIGSGTKRKANAGPVTLEEYNDAAACYAGIAPPEFFEKWRDFYVGTDRSFTFNEVAPISDDEFADRLSEHLEQHFCSVSAPTDEDERLEFDILKMKLERLVARYSPTPDKLSNVFERFLDFSRIKTRAKYDRVFKRFIKHSQDIPISQVTPTMLREYRTKLLAEDLAISSVKAAFTPLKSLFRFAFDEELISSNPVRDITFPPDRRPIQEVKALPFTQDEADRILNSVDQFWLKPFPYLDDDRRLAIRQIVRALAFTAARPIELMSLKREDVTEDAINIRRTKTKSSWRYLPIHPEIADFPAFVANGGIECLMTNHTDPVEPVRHNFIRLLREHMENPILESRKKLYSFRASFQDALRRVGAPLEVRQAILGHTEGGAIKHYNSGPEFALMCEWVNKADPRK
ncbi:phage integrase SAM-like domain-containing protein [Pseudohalocynthiibacter sp. F2068]|uniref:tyrosine-type recombinase/integrase n=1 Tax=Pseudohalocynthiibacter sp. F2068 TaxID=2926418 RepID=UPI001FF25370|nr:phage integrase SAM-like domain-containing protein [Pseudohalocynthiibacter sp. F2068]MCK0104395.1 phage integrase SAM-like domain-containing protein [Pseudohalocynthiibacter sp. F2068]